MLPLEIGPGAIGALVMLCLAIGGTEEIDPGKRARPALVARDFQPVHRDRWIGNAVCYGPHRDGQWPGGPTPTSAEIRADLRIMAAHWRLVRLYGSSEFGRTVLDAIRSTGLGMKVMLGVWIAPEEERDEQGNVRGEIPGAAEANRRELETAIALAAEYPDIVLAVCVGNETQVSWSAHRCPLDSLIGYVRSVRAAVAVPVTTADDYQYWREPESRVLAREIDFITMHAHPLWNGRQLDEALPWLREQLAAVRSTHPENQIVIGETGWATCKASEGEQARQMKGTTGESEQARFYHAVRGWILAKKITTFFFEAFDENWKGGRDLSDAEKHWGFFRADRTPKAAIR